MRNAFSLSLALSVSKLCHLLIEFDIFVFFLLVVYCVLYLFAFNLIWCRPFDLDVVRCWWWWRQRKWCDVSMENQNIWVWQIVSIVLTGKLHWHATNRRHVVQSIQSLDLCKYTKEIETKICPSQRVCALNERFRYWFWTMFLHIFSFLSRLANFQLRSQWAIRQTVYRWAWKSKICIWHMYGAKAAMRWKCWCMFSDRWSIIIDGGHHQYTAIARWKKWFTVSTLQSGFGLWQIVNKMDNKNWIHLPNRRNGSWSNNYWRSELYSCHTVCHKIGVQEWGKSGIYYGWCNAGRLTLDYCKFFFRKF